MARKLVTIDRGERTYVPRDWMENGEPEQGALTFKFIPLSVRQLAAFQDNSSRMSLQTSTLLLGSAGVSIDTFRASVCGWENYIVDGEEVIFKKDNTNQVKESLIESLPLDVIEEVAKHIIEVSKFPEEEKGK